MNPISFKPEQQDKLETFMRIIGESRGHAFDPTGRQSDIRNITSVYQRNGGDFWALESGDAIVGTIALKVLDPGIGEIKRYFVLPSLQGKGLGQTLMRHATHAATSSGLRKLRLDTMKNSKAALAIFSKHGFYEIEKYNDNDVAEIFLENTLPDGLIIAG